MQRIYHETIALDKMNPAMKAAFILSLSLAGLIAIGLVIEVLAADDPPEFYFTRLVYTENGNRRGGGFGRNFGFREQTMPKPADPFICPEFGGSTFFPRQGWG